MMFRLVGRAVLAGVGAGLFASILHLWLVQPVLLHAELFEAGELIHFGGGEPTSSAMEWSGIDPGRDGLTIFFTTMTYTGWALILIPLMSLAERQGAGIGVRSGMIWGVAGYATVLLAPALTVPPEVPGVATVDVQVRQIWWFATVISTGAALWMIAFSRHRGVWIFASALLAIPHLAGFPGPDSFLGPAPPELGAMMAARVLGVGLAAWAVLGALAGYLWERDSERAVAKPA